jgi:hypothetical protein
LICGRLSARTAEHREVWKWCSPGGSQSQRVPPVHYPLFVGSSVLSIHWVIYKISNSQLGAIPFHPTRCHPTLQVWSTTAPGKQPPPFQNTNRTTKSSPQPKNLLDSIHSRTSARKHQPPFSNPKLELLGHENTHTHTYQKNEQLKLPRCEFYPCFIWVPRDETSLFVVGWDRKEDVGGDWEGANWEKAGKEKVDGRWYRW